MIHSVRCHAVIDACGIHKGGVVVYDGEAVPAHGQRSIVAVNGNVNVRNVSGEVHSTVDYNGIAIAGECPLTADMHITVDNIAEKIAEVADRGVLFSDKLYFIPLG